MMAITQQDLIVMYLRSRAGQWIAGYALTRVEVVVGPGDVMWLSHNASRRARELAEDAVIERALINGEVHYRVPAGPPMVPDAAGTLHQQPGLPL